MSIWSKYSDFVDLGFGRNAPAIWLYPPKPTRVSVELGFLGRGLMTLSVPAYNNGWIVEADASKPLPIVRGVYDGGAHTYLDYDGFRDGDFQTRSGWVVEQKDLLQWQRSKLRELAFHENEIDDVNYAYGRLLLMRNYPERFFLVYPQVQAIVDASVSLKITPAPESVYRLWLYFIPTNDPPVIAEPKLSPVSRVGFTAVELGFLTASEQPGAMTNDVAARQPAARAAKPMLTSPRFAKDVA